MKTSPFLVLAAVLLAVVSSGQTSRSGAAVDPTEAVPAFTPVEFKDGVLTFHMYAPQARQVEVRGEAITVAGKEFLPMAKDERGVWSASLSGLRPDGYTYIYMVDGAPTVDQKNTGAKVGPRGNNNRFLMPGYPDFYADKPVPHLADLAHEPARRGSAVVSLTAQFVPCLRLNPGSQREAHS
jgi:hypothetical protein